MRNFYARPWHITCSISRVFSRRGSVSHRISWGGIVFSLFFSALFARAADCIPADLRLKLDDENTIDHAQTARGKVSGPLDRQSIPPRRGAVAIREGVLRVVPSPVSPELIKQRVELPEKMSALRGFRATFNGPEIWPLALRTNATPAELAAEALIRERLSCEGLLQVGAAVARALKLTDENAADSLRRVGYPVDLLDHFTHPNGSAPLKLLVAGDDGQLAKTAFKWRPSAPGFSAASENGFHPIRSVRLQLRGDYHDGIVPGSGFDIAGKLIGALPEARFLMSVQATWAEATQAEAFRGWRLRKRNHVTLFAEPLEIGGWAQDNGKGGSLGNAPAVLAPRYASLDNEEAEFSPADSYSLDSLRAAGIRVVQSALLFQGGNTLVVRDPKNNQRVLLLSEIEVWRNVRLGLTRDQVLEGFKIDFNVDGVLVMPMVSYHLDYEVTCRIVDGKVLALVNDPLPLARRIVELVETRAKAAGLNPAALDEKDPRVTALFRTSGIDSPSVNLMVYRVAQDWLNAHHGEDTEYHAALRRQIGGMADLRRVLQEQGWEVVAVASMPAMRVGINYLNGLQDRTRFVMPTYGGFYAPIDDMTIAEIRAAYKGIEVVPIPCPQLQTHQGALHCVVSIFPPTVDLPN